MRPVVFCSCVILFLVQTQLCAAEPAFTCLANAGTPVIVRVEGITELSGDLLLHCTGGTPTPAGQPIPAYNITATYNTNVTSRLVNGNVSEALLLIDDPYPAQPIAWSQFLTIPSNSPAQIACAPGGVLGGSCPETGTGGGSYGSTSNPYLSQPNFFAGTLTQPNQITWSNIPLDAPGANSVHLLRITNVRANASQLGLSGTLIPTQVVIMVAIIPVNGAPVVSVINPQQTVAYIHAGLVGAGNSARLAQCSSHNPGLLGGTAPSTFDFTIRALEHFAQAMRRRNVSVTIDGVTAPQTYAQNVPGFAYNNESALYIPSLVPASPGIGLADFGTRIRITFNNVAPGTHLFVPLTAPIGIDIAPDGHIYPGQPLQALPPVPLGIWTPQARLIQADQYGNSQSPGFVSAAATANIAGTDVAEVSYVGNSAYAVYEVLTSDESALEFAYIPVAVAFSSSNQSRPTLGDVSVATEFAPAGGPLATSSTADSTSRIPRFLPSDNPQSRTAYTIAACPVSEDFGGTGQSGALLYEPSTGTAYAALSNGNGSFTYAYNLFTAGFDTLRTAHFDGFGTADLILYNSHNGIGYSGYGKRDGTFNWSSLFWSPGYDFVESGDLNADALTDFILYNSSTGTLYSARADGLGGFTYKYTLVSRGYTAVRLADFTGDGKADLFAYNSNTAQASLGIGDGAGGFTFSPLFISAGYTIIDTGDLNDDGKADLILYSAGSGNAATGISDGSGGFAFHPMLFSPGFTSVRLADHTGDGKADVTVYNKATGAAYFGTGTSAGSFNFQSLFWSPGFDNVVPEDVNGDGKTDVVLYNSATGTSYTGVSTGAGGFSYTYAYWGIGKMLAR